MRYAAPFNPDLTAAEAHVASLRDWLVGVLAWLAAIFEPARRKPAHACTSADLRMAVRQMRQLLFVKAVVELGLRPQPRRGRGGHQPVLNQRERDIVRAVTARIFSACTRGRLEQRLAAFEHVLANEQIYLSRIVARMRRVRGKLRVIRLISPRPKNSARPQSFVQPASAYADTS